MLRRQKPDVEPREPIWLLRRGNQTVLAGIGFAALICLAALWHFHGGPDGSLIELEQLPRGTLRFEIDVNEADWPELCQLPQVGEVLARRIVDYREAHGPFRKAEDLRKVRGIGPKTLDQIRPYLGSFETQSPAR